MSTRNKIAMCRLGSAPLREKKSWPKGQVNCSECQAPLGRPKPHHAEMVTQLLLGDKVEILDHHQRWYRVITCFDRYEGLLDHRAVEVLPEDDGTDDALQMPVLSSLLGEATNLRSGHSFTITYGTALPNFVPETREFAVGTTRYALKSGEVRRPRPAADPEAIFRDAKMFLGVPYLWGGRSAFGIDCSGYMQILFKAHGVKLKRDASQQIHEGQVIPSLDEAAMGDLIFFGPDRDTIAHVGMICGPRQIIHSSGYVRIDPVTDEGVNYPPSEKIDSVEPWQGIRRFI